MSESPSLNAVVPEPLADRQQPPILARWRLVCVSVTEPPWTTLAWQLAEAGIPDPRIEWVDSAALLMASLRQDRYDAILINHSSDGVQIHSRQVISALRGGGHRNAVIVLLSTPNDQLAAELAQWDCDAVVSPAPWESPALLPTIQRAIRQADLQRSHQALQVRQQRQQHRDREEAAQMLQQQHDLLAALIREPSPLAIAETLSATAALQTDYQELLRMFVLRSSDRTGDEIRQLAAALIHAGITPQQAMKLHVDCVQTLVDGLGERSSRHILHQADLFALDLMLHLADGYRQHPSGPNSVAA